MQNKNGTPNVINGYVNKSKYPVNIPITKNKYDIYLQLTLTENGKNIIKEISKQYVQYKDSEGNDKTDRISIRIDRSPIMTTYFGEEYDQAVLNIPISRDVSVENLSKYIFLLFMANIFFFYFQFFYYFISQFFSK